MTERPPVIVVSHRGPYSFRRGDDGQLTAQRGAGGIVSALSPLLAEKTDVTWIAAAMSDDDNAAESHGPRLADLDVGVQLLDLDREQHRMHYDVVANGVLWFLHHGMFDHARRPRFDLHFRDAWDAFVAVNQRFTDAVVGDRDRGRHRARPGLPAHPDRRSAAARSAPTCGSCTSRTRRSRAPTTSRSCPTDVAEALCGALASGPAGFHTKRWGEGYRQSARATLGRRSEHRRAVRGEPRARRRRARRGRGLRAGASGREQPWPTPSATGS